MVKTLEFKSETGMPQYDSVGRKVYVNLRNTNEIVEIDPSTDTVVGTYPGEGCRYKHGMAIDSEHHRAFLLCNGTKTLTVFASPTKQLLICPSRKARMSSSSIPAWGVSVQRVPVVSLPFSSKMTRISIESWKILCSRKWCTVLLWILRRTEFTRRSSKRTGSRWLE